jgi:hypothetical protein
MSDFAVTPFEPIVQGVVTYAGPLLSWEGVGLEAIQRLPGHAAGAYLLTLDEGLPGNSGAVPPGAAPTVNPDVRTVITCRAPVPPAVNPIQTTGILYLPIVPIPGVGCTFILVVMADNTNTLADPVAFEINVFRVFNG